MNKSEKILVISEETSRRAQLRNTLELHCFDVGEAADGEGARTRLQMVDYDAVLFDVLTFDDNGVLLCTLLRRLHSRLPIIVVSASENLDNTIKALETGADDCVLREISARELGARLRSAIRRFHAPDSMSVELLVVGDIVLDPTMHQVEKSGKEVPLSPLEFHTLQMLMQSSGKPVSYSHLLIALWGEESKRHHEHLRVVMRGLRKKLEDDPTQPVYLTTQPYFGYCVRDHTRQKTTDKANRLDAIRRRSLHLQPY